jgi:hypothetical protein
MRSSMDRPTSQAAVEAAVNAQRNRYVVSSFALLCVLALLMVSGLPKELVPLALQQLFVLASLGAGLVALLWREAVFARHLTHWDKAAALLGVGLVAGQYVDPQAVQQALDVLQASAIEEMTESQAGLNGE